MNRVAPLEGRLFEIYRNQLSAQDDAQESVNPCLLSNTFPPFLPRSSPQDTEVKQQIKLREYVIVSLEECCKKEIQKLKSRDIASQDQAWTRRSAIRCRSISIGRRRR